MNLDQDALPSAVYLGKDACRFAVWASRGPTRSRFGSLR